MVLENASMINQNSFWFSGFTFVYFSLLSFKFIQLRPLRQLLLNFFNKILENIFQSLMGFFKIKYLKKKI